MQILVRLLIEEEEEDVVLATATAPIPSLDSLVIRTQVIQVPAQKPQRRVDYDLAQTVWPGSFHANQQKALDLEQDDFLIMQRNAEKWMLEATASASANSQLPFDL